MGICGIVTMRNGTRVEALTLDAMVRTMSMTSDWQRVSVVDHPLGFGAAAPTCTVSACRSERAVVVCDADLVNLPELRAVVPPELARSSPAEIVGLLYSMEGMKFLSKLRGSFSIAVWDPGEEKLLLA